MVLYIDMIYEIFICVVHFLYILKRADFIGTKYRLTVQILKCLW